MEAPQTHLSTLISGSYQPRTYPSNPNFPINPLKICGLNKLIFSYLDPVSLARASRVCKAWHAIANDDVLWTTFINRHKLWSDKNVKSSVLQQFGVNRCFSITKDKNHLFTQVMTLLAQQRWNQSATFTCFIGPKTDDKIILTVRRNPMCPSGDNCVPLEPINTQFFIDKGPAQPDPLNLPSVALDIYFSEQSERIGLHEYFASIPCPLKNHPGSYEAQVLMPHSVASLYFSHFKTLADNQLVKLAKEEKSLKTKESLSRAFVIGYALERNGMYGNGTEGFSLNRLKDKGQITNVSI